MWFKVDDSFFGHPKAANISNDSLATWTRAGNWSAWQLTDGSVPVGMLRLCAGDADDPEAVAADLVDRRLWEIGDGGWQFHDWSDYNPTRDQVLSKRKLDAERKRRVLNARRDPVSGRSRSGFRAESQEDSARNPGVTEDGDDLASANGQMTLDGSAGSHGVTPAGIRAESHQPDPTRPEGSGVHVGESSSGRNARTPEDDDETLAEITQVQALMAAAGRPVSSEDAATIRATVLAKGGRVRNRAAFIGRVLGDAKQARAYAPGSGPHAPTAREIIESSHRPGGPGDAGAGAAEARRLLAERDRPEPRGPETGPGLHGEALARRQLAEIASTRKPVDPPPDDDDPPAEDDPGEEQYPF